MAKQCPICDTPVVKRENKFCSRACYDVHQKRHPHGKFFQRGHSDLIPAKSRKCQGVRISGEGNGRWKGTTAGYVAKHRWVRRAFGTPMQCEKCGVVETSGYRMQWANISGQYLRERSDWKRLCAKCHKNYDVAKRKQVEAIAA